MSFRVQIERPQTTTLRAGSFQVQHGRHGRGTRSTFTTIDAHRARPSRRSIRAAFDTTHDHYDDRLRTRCWKRRTLRDIARVSAFG